MEHVLIFACFFVGLGFIGISLLKVQKANYMVHDAVKWRDKISEVLLYGIGGLGVVISMTFLQLYLF